MDETTTSSPSFIRKFVLVADDCDDNDDGDEEDVGGNDVEGVVLDGNKKCRCRLVVAPLAFPPIALFHRPSP